MATVTFRDVQDQFQLELYNAEGDSQVTLVGRQFRELAANPAEAKSYAERLLLEQVAKIRILSKITVSDEILPFAASVKEGLNDALSTIGIGIEEKGESVNGYVPSIALQEAKQVYIEGREYTGLTESISEMQEVSTEAAKGILQTAFEKETAKLAVYIQELFKDLDDKTISTETAFVLDDILKEHGFQLCAVDYPQTERLVGGAEIAVDIPVDAPLAYEVDSALISLAQLADTFFSANNEYHLMDKTFTDNLLQHINESLVFCLDDDQFKSEYLDQEDFPGSEECKAFFRSICKDQDMTKEAFIESLKLEYSKLDMHISLTYNQNIEKLTQVVGQYLTLARLDTALDGTKKKKDTLHVGEGRYYEMDPASVTQQTAQVVCAMITQIITEYASDVGYNYEAFSAAYPYEQFASLHDYLLSIVNTIEFKHQIIADQEHLLSEHRLYAHKTLLKAIEVDKDLAKPQKTDSSSFYSKHSGKIKKAALAAGATAATAYATGALSFLYPLLAAAMI